MLIALAGRAGSGKNEVAKALAAVRHVREFSFAGPLKDFCGRVFGFTEAQLYGPSSERNKPDPRWPREGGGFLTPRHALQTLGTEWGRACSENVWADLGVREARAWLAVSGPGAVAVITDCRFSNEARAVRAAGGEVWRVVRPGAGLGGSAGAHPSELEQASPEFLELVTRTIKNAGSLEDLHRQVASVIA